MATKPLWAWSHSGLDTAENCPRKLWATKIKKLVNDDNDNNRQGAAEHESIEFYLKSGQPKHLLPRVVPNTNPQLMTGDLSALIPVFDKFRNAPGEKYYEFEMTLDNDLVPCGWRDWNRAWLRGAADLLIVNGPVAIYVDWKSGKFSPKDEQIETMALLVFRHFPEVQELRGTLFFYRGGKDKVVHKRTVFRSEEPAIWVNRRRRVAAIETLIKSDTFPATPNGLCGYCPYGACQYNKNPKAQR